MNILFLGRNGTWNEVYRSCAITARKKQKSPPESSLGLSDEWKLRILFSEHSPIRQLLYRFCFENIPYWVSVHLVRHKIGIEHFVSSSRPETIKQNRNILPQNYPVNHEIIVNAQAMINISRKRLCQKASPETRMAWGELVKMLRYVEPVLAQVCVPECVYRGFCPEMKPCGYAETEKYAKERQEYVGLIKKSRLTGQD